MNALILNGSPVRNGATAWIAEEMTRQLQPRFTLRSACISSATCTLPAAAV